MRNLHKIFLPLAAVALLMGSCKKSYLDTAPTDQVDGSEVFKNTTNAMAALNGIHRSLYMQYSRQEEGGQGSVNLNMDYMGNDIVNAVSTTTFGVHKWVTHRNATTLNNAYIYSYFYKIIQNANKIIDNIDGAEGPDNEKKLIKAEAFTYRAWAHFNLVQVFAKRYDQAGNNTQAGVPIKITSVQEGGQPRAAVEAVYAQVNKDLDAAFVLFATAKVRPNKSHLNLNVAKGIKARVALTQGKWADAAQLAIEARGAQALMTPEDYVKGFNSVDNVEWMWGSKQVEDQTTYFYSFFAYMGTYNSTANRTNPKRILSTLYNRIPATDVRVKLWDPTGKNPDFPLTPGGIRSTFMQAKFTNAGTTSIGDVVHMRVAEMYLIEAEARAHLAVEGNAAENAKAAAALFTLVNKRNPSYTLSANTGAALLNEILIQRRIELWGEGFGFLDLKRLNAPVDRTGGNATVALAGVLTVPAGGPEWQWMIPLDEINSNPAIGQGGQNP